MMKMNQTYVMPEIGNISMGWLADYPDFRDYTVDTEVIFSMLATAKMEDQVAKDAKVTLPTSVDLKQWFSPIEDQENIGSCTAQAGVGLVEYFQRKAFGKHVDTSRLFLYKVTRNLLHWQGDTGAYLRATMAALRCFGVPPEQYWPYDVERFDEEPPAFLYALGQNYKAISYFRLDPLGTTRPLLLKRIKTTLAGQIPCMFGFTVYSSIAQSAKTGLIPFPGPKESREGGHAVVAVGYDDKVKIKGPSKDAPETRGALLIRNSWGRDWGEGGYGWLPYEYVIRGLAVDWWSMLDQEWVDTGEFGL
jgi:C1A family cysteine protease